MDKGNEKNLRILKNTAMRLGASVAAIIDTKDLSFDPRSQFMCISCRRYGKKATCPPFLPETSYFRPIISQYQSGLLVGVKEKVRDSDKSEIDNALSLGLHKILLDLEKRAFEMGYFFATSLIGGSCKWCSTEPSARERAETCQHPCEDPTHGRIPMEAIGIDVVKTCKKLRISLRFPVEKDFWRIGLLLVK